MGAAYGLLPAVSGSAGGGSHPFHVLHGAGLSWKAAGSGALCHCRRRSGPRAGGAYRLFGTPELAEAAVETCGEGKAVLLGNHGLVVWESSLPKAFALARDLEFTAELQWRAMAVGTPNILTDGQMAEALERFKTYGQPKKQDAKNTN